MKGIRDIFFNDLKNIGTNWAAMIIIGGLVILPSLYAWFNIAAMWDPYSNTGNLPVGIVNEDKGAAIRDEEIHVGDELIKTLKENESMQWHFDTREAAMKNVEDGDYYAAIIIPENFSEQLSTVISNDPQKAQIEYYVNEKLNSVSPKITEKGATSIVDQISSKFVSTVNGVIFDIFNQIGVELETELPDIEKFEDYIFTLEKNIPEIDRLLGQSTNDIHSAEGMLTKSKEALPKAKEYTNAGLETVNKTLEVVTKAEKRLKEVSPQIESELANIQKTSASVESFLEDIQRTDVDTSQEEGMTGTIENQVDQSIGSLEVVQGSLEQLKELSKTQTGENGENPSTEQIDEALKQNEQLLTSMKDIQKNVNQLNKVVGVTSKDYQTTLENLKRLASDTSVKMDEFVKEYNSQIEPTILNELDKANNTLSGAKNILTEIQSTLPKAEKILTNTEGTLKEGKEALGYANNEFPYVSKKINEVADKIRKAQAETDINEIIDLLRNDPTAEKNFFEEPVQLNENKLFPIANYGTGMTPFYTVLAIWVGGLLLISLLTVDVHGNELYTGKQVYFGRLFTFWTIGLAQTIIVTLGDLFILGVKAESPVWMIVFGLFISLIFVLIVYSLVSVFGNVGKALAIVMLVLQIAGSGGTYPVVLLPRFFQVISPFLPFTYAVDLMREAVGGIVWRSALYDLLILSLFGLLAILIGAVLKEPINKQTKKFLEKSKESGLVH